MTTGSETPSFERIQVIPVLKGKITYGVLVAIVLCYLTGDSFVPVVQFSMVLTIPFFFLTKGVMVRMDTQYRSGDLSGRRLSVYKTLVIYQFIVVCWMFGFLIYGVYWNVYQMHLARGG